MKCTQEFRQWIGSLDRSLRIRIDQRLLRLEGGNPGSHRNIDRISELKWSTGAIGSFRVYYAEFEDVILLLGGHKDSQSKDIEKAKGLLKEIEDGKKEIKDYE